MTEERIVAAAMDLADAQGADALTMRAIAEALGVQAMSLYNHVANKDALLDRMVDAVFARVALPTTGDWKTAMRARALSMYGELKAHPWAIGLLESRRAPGATTLQHHDATIGVLRDAGFSAAVVAHTLALLDAYVYGFALQESSLPLEPDEEVASLAGEILASAPTLTNLAWLATEQVTSGRYSFSDELEYGLELLLEGLDRRVRAEPDGHAAHEAAEGASGADPARRRGGR